jgi:cyclic pyranopterin phosphate synthase
MLNTPPIEYRPYTSLRLKLLEACQLRCRFCHHEGNASVRLVDVETALESARKMRNALGLNKVHLTGGEPTLYPHLFELIERLASHHFQVAITSHGLFSEEKCQRLYHLLKHGDLTYMNFSLHTLQPEQHLAINGRALNETNYEDAKKALQQIKRNITQLAQVGIVNINCVAAHDSQSLIEVFEFARENRIRLRLVPDWTALNAAHCTIGGFLRARQAEFSTFVVIYPTSNYSARYQVDGTSLDVKLIRPVGLESLCTGCAFVRKCVEFFGNVRLEGNPLHVRLCIHRQGKPYALPLLQFLESTQCHELRQHLLEPPPEISDPFGSGLREPFGLQELPVLQPS